MSHALALAASLALSALLDVPKDWPKSDQRVACGPLTIEVYVSRTPHLFHVVDQLSAWDNSCHGQYREHMSLSAEDEQLLAEYAAVRQERRWGQGLEQTFYTPLDLDAAIRAGVKAGNVTAEECAVIRPVLVHFAPRVEELLASKQAYLADAFGKIDRARMTQAAESLARFCGVKKLAIPAFPLASPAPGGGGMDGGRLKWELDSDRVPFSVLLHETTHAFFDQCGELLDQTVASTPGLSRTLLGEGFAYAMAPGLYGDDESDNLLHNVAQDRANDQAWNDPGPGRFREYALALRPLFAEALKTSKLEEFLPRARDVFIALQSVESARPGRGGPPKLAIAGPARDVVRERLLESRFDKWIQCLDHDPANYADVLGKLGKGDLFVLLVARDDGGRIPAVHAALSPVPLDELDKRLAKGETIEKEGTAGDVRIVLLAAPSKVKLAQLAKQSELIHD